MLTPLYEIIRNWAAAESIPLTGLDEGTGSTRMWLLECGHVQGEFRLLQVREASPSYQITVMRGRMVVDESWADHEGMAACLSMGLRLLQQRVKTTTPQWHLHLGDLPA